MTDTRKAMQQALEALSDFARFQSMMMDGPDDSDRMLAEDYAEAGFKKMPAAIEALREALSQQGEPVAGWKRVPVEPTQEMVDAVKRAYPDNRFTRDSYRAMLAAAPAAQPDTKVICNWDGIGADK